MTDENVPCHEFTCTECGREIIALCHTSEFELCAACLMMPGWHEDPKLVAILDPGKENACGND